MKHLLKLSDLCKREILAILNTADQMKFSLTHRLEKKPLAGKTLAMIFSQPSVRAHVSFETGMYQLGGQPLLISGNDVLGGEPAEDIARSLSRYVDGIAVRAFSHLETEELASFSAVPVINGMTDLAHPCQALAGLMTIRERFSALEDLKVCFVGGCGGICNSLIVGAVTCGMKISAAVPEGDPHPDVLKLAGSKLLLTRNPLEAAEGADVVYTTSYSGLPDGFQVNGELLAVASAEAMVLHSLPVHRGIEISAEVFEAHSAEIFEQTENRLHVQKAVMAMLMGSDEE